MPPTAESPMFVVMVQGGPGISGMCGCEWAQAGLLQVMLASLSFIDSPGCEYQVWWEMASDSQKHWHLVAECRR